MCSAEFSPADEGESFIGNESGRKKHFVVRPQNTGLGSRWAFYYVVSYPVKRGQDGKSKISVRSYKKHITVLV